MKLDILAFAAHPDDVELSAAGTLLKAKEEGKKTGIVDLTRGELGSRGSAELRDKEAALASERLGLSVRRNLALADGFFENNQTNKLAIIKMIRAHKPEIVLANAPSDRHPDHGKGSQLVREAAFLAGLVKIETTFEGKPQEAWRPRELYFYIQDRYLKPDFVVDISEHFQQKIKVIQSYSSQFFNPDEKGTNTPISGEDFMKFLEGRARQLGREAGVEMGEGFISERTLGIKSLSQLLD